MTSFFSKRLAIQTVALTLTISLAMLTLRIIDSPSSSAFSLDKKAEKVKKSAEDRDSKRDRDDDDDDDSSEAKKVKREKKKEKEDKKREFKNKDKDKDKEDDDDDDDDDKVKNKQDKKDDDDDDEDSDDDDDDDSDKKKSNKKDDDDDDDGDDDDVKNTKEVAEKLSPVSAPDNEVVASTLTAPVSAAAFLTVTATVETTPIPSGGDAADDPAIWVDTENPSQSRLIGSNKQGGLALYSLDGQQLQYLPDGLMNNVDIRAGFQLNGQATAIITASNRRDNSIAIYRLNPSTRLLENVAARKIVTTPAYGACMYRSPKTDKLYYFVTGKTGEVEQWELADNGSGKVDAKRVRGFKLGSTVEGCVADDELGHLYISEEAVGIWKFNAEPTDNSKGIQVDKAGAGGHLTADVEGLTIAYGKDGSGYLMASSQGNNSYVVYKREGNNEYIETFRIAQGNSIDGTEETDGIDVTTANLGPLFPQGVFVVQDGINDKGNQNFKLVPFQQVLSIVKKSQ